MSCLYVCHWVEATDEGSEGGSKRQKLGKGTPKIAQGSFKYKGEVNHTEGSADQRFQGVTDGWSQGTGSEILGVLQGEKFGG